MDTPLVSVIIPNYNHADYLDQRIASVLNQTYRHFEIIILDDHSTDNSSSVIERYRNNPKVSHIVVNEENGGTPFVQWNKGLKLAQGELIWIAESDDYCEPLFLEELVSAYMDNPDSVVVYCSSLYVDSNGNSMETYKEDTYPIVSYEGEDFIKEKLAFGCAIWNASSAIFRRSTALLIDGQYQDFKACGDRLFWMKMAEKGRIVHVNQHLNYFRQHLNKVSPTRFRDGTSLREEYRIYQYQREKRYLSGWKRIFVLSLYYDKINEGEFSNSSVKIDLLRLWGFSSRLYVATIKILARFYIYFGIYIKHRKPL